MNKNRIVQRLAIGGMVLAILAGCHSPSQERGVANEPPSSEKSSPIAEVPNNLNDVRQPDVKIHVKRGQTLAMQTEGMTLTAIDAAVQHEA